MQGFKPRSGSAKGKCYADGGVVETIKGLFTGSKGQQQEKPAPAPSPSPSPEMLGNGMAANAGRAILAHHQRLRDADNFADGGVVQYVKDALGFKPQPHQPPEAPKATPEMLGNGMAAQAGNAILAHHQRLRDVDNYADGGMVRGPGTGTSDDVHKQVREGTFIMPADSTQQIGPETLEDMGKQGVGGKPVPVNLSNGEYELPPEQVHAIGVQTLDNMKNQTHTPVANRGSKGFKPESFFADGGEVDDPQKKSAGILDGVAGSYKAAAGGLALPFAAGIDAARRGAASMAGGDPNTLPGGPERFADAASQTIQSGVGQMQAAADAQRGALRDFMGVQPAAPAAAPQQAAKPAMAPVSTAQPQPQPSATAAPGTVEPANTAPAAAPAVGNVTMTGNRAKDGGGASYSGSNIGENFTINGQAPKGGYMVAPAGPTAQAATAAPASDGMGFQPQSMNRGPSVVMIGNSNAGDSDRQKLIDAASRPLPGSRGGQLTANQLRVLADVQSGEQRDATARYTADANNQGAMERALVNEQGATDRAAMASQADMGRLNLDREAQGFKTRAAQREESLVQKYDAAKTPEERSAIAQQIRDLSGKESPNRFTVVPGGQEIDQSTQQLVTRPSSVFNNQTGQFVETSQAARQLPPIDQNQAALAIKNNTKLSREERVAQLRALGYQ